MAVSSNITGEKKQQRTEDKKLVRRMLSGEDQAYVDFVDRYKDRLYAAMTISTSCGHEAEEIVQETFVKAIQHLPGFHFQSNLYTWLYRIAWNEAISRSRRLRADVSLETSEADKQSQAPESFGPHVSIERREQVDVLRKAMARLEVRHRSILVMREFEEMSYQEIADQMDVPLGTVRSRLARARERLREELERVTVPRTYRNPKHDGSLI